MIHYLRFFLLVILISGVIVACKKSPAEPETLAIIQKVLVEGGDFMMGNTLGNAGRDQLPPHLVSISSFYLSKYEITEAQYQSIMGNNPSSSVNNNQPVEMVSWYDAVVFCNALTTREGLTPCYAINGKDITCNFSLNGYRLPTEAEWEYASRGGNWSRGYKFSGSNDVNQVAWYYSNSGGRAIRWV